MKVEIGIVILAFLGGMGVQSQIDEKPAQEHKDWGENPMENPEFMEAMMAAATPGAEHEHIQKAVGKWDVDSTIYMMPDAPGMPSTAEVEVKSILGGRYILETYKSEFMGMPTEGLLLMGYDNLAEEYVSIWMDTYSTWPSISRGKRNKDGKLVQAGIMRDITTPDGRPYKHVSWEEGDDVMRAEMMDTMPDGTEWKVMDFTYKRQK